MGDISSVVQVLALGGFLAGFAGIAFVVAAASQGRPVRGGVVLAAAGLVAGVVLMVVSQGLLVVGPTERAVVFNTLSGDLEDPRESGIHIIIPGIQQTFLYPISQQNYTMSDTSSEGERVGADAIRARSVDGQEVRIDITILFRLFDTPDQLNTIHRDWSNEPGGYREGLIRPAVRSIVRDIVAAFEAEAIYGTGREEMQRQIDERITTRLQESGIEVTDFLVRDINFSAEFIASIEAKQVEEQALQRAVTEAQRRRTEAQGLADADIERARGVAESRLIEARAEAEALRLISQQIAANPSLIQYTYIQNLSDNVSIALVPSNSPFLFDFESLADPDANFTAPDVPDVSVDDITGEDGETSSGN
jgi:regulator of protease activity HflC (stomatin/prohibitin superfamily)